MEDHYKESLHQAQAELAALEKRREARYKLIETLNVLSEDDTYELNPPPGYVPKGLTDEMRIILTLTNAHLDPVQIRDALLKRGFKGNPKNVLIAVHTVLGRIKAELDVMEREGKPAYCIKEAAAVFEARQKK